MTMTNENSMRVLIADRQFRVRSALRLLLSQEPDLTVVGEAGAAEEAVELTAEYQPHVVLLDWDMPLNGHSALSRLREERPGVAVIALSERPEACREALDEGADAVVSKGAPPEALLAALRECGRPEKR